MTFRNYMICKNMKKQNFSLPVIIFLTLSAAIALSLISASAVEARLATDVVGQTDASGTISYTTRFPDNAIPNQRGMYTPAGIVMDTVNHWLFVSDYTDNRVLVYNLDVNNNLVDRVADYVLGQPGFITGATSTGASGMNAPYGLAINVSSSLLFVADHLNNRVLVFDVSGITNGEDAIKVLGQTDFTGIAASTGQNRFNRPYGLALNSSSSVLFVSDQNNNRILAFDVTEITNGENAINILGQAGNFDTSSWSTSQSGIYTPKGLAFNAASNTLFVSDSSNHRVIIFDVAEITDGENAVNVLGQSDFISGTSGVTQNKFYYPGWVEYDAVSNTLYVSDSYNYRVMVFDLSIISNGENAVNVLGQSNFTTNVVRTDQSAINKAGDIYLDSVNRMLYVSDIGNSRVDIFNVAQISDGENAVNTLGQLDSNDDPVYTTKYINNTAPSASGLRSQTDIVLDSVNHRLFVSDSTNNRILVYNLANNNVLIDRAADYVLGQANFVNAGTSTSQSGLNSPYGLAFDNANNRLFAADRTNNRVLVFNTVIVTNGENAINVLGQANFTSSGSGLSSSTFNNPQDIAYDASNNHLFVSDRSNNRIVVFDATTITDGEGAVNVLGQANFTSNSNASTQAGFDAPVGLYYDGTNNRLFVADLNNDRVVVYNVAEIADGENAVNVLGQTNFTGNAAATTQSRLARPEILAYDSDRNLLFVDDSGNARVMVFDLSELTDGENAVNVIGESNFTSKIITSDQSNFSPSYGLDYDSASRQLFVSDSGYNRLLIFNLIVLSTSTFSDAKYGVSYTATVTSSNYQGTLSYAVTSGTLPSGITLATSTGVLSGTPSATGSFSFTITATESESTGDYSDSQNFSLTIGHPTVQFSSGSSSDNERYSVPSVHITLSDSSVYDVTLTLSTMAGTAQGNGLDYSVSSTITISAGATSSGIPLRVISDDTIESDETIVFTIATSANASLGTQTTHTFTIVNDDAEGSMGAVYQGGSGSVGSGASSPGAGSRTPVSVPVVVSPTPVSGSSANSQQDLARRSSATPQALPPSYIFRRSLSRGSKGDVRRLQEKLRELGYFKYPRITEFYGPVTANAVRDLQRFLKSKGFFRGPVTGYFGPLTRQAVLKLDKQNGQRANGGKLR